MTWDELKTKAKEMGYEPQKDYGGKSIGKDGIVFCADGFVKVYYDEKCRILKTDCAYDKMFMIMRGLE